MRVMPDCTVCHKPTTNPTVTREPLLTAGLADDLHGVLCEECEAWMPLAVLQAHYTIREDADGPKTFPKLVMTVVIVGLLAWWCWS